MLFDESALWERLRERVNECLSFAYELALVDNDLSKRLQARSWVRFDEAVCELKIGLIFRYLGFNVAPFPEAKNNRTGEWSVSKNGFQLFVEVKTPNPPKPLLDSMKMLRHAENVHSAERKPLAVQIAQWQPFSTEVFCYPSRQFSPDTLDIALRKAMERFEALGGQELIEEKGKNFSLQIKREPERRGISFILLDNEGIPLWQKYRLTIQERLIDIIRKAQRGLNMPSVIVLNDPSFMFDAFKSNTDYDLSPLWYRSHAAMLENLSAVLIFRESFPVGDQRLAIFHHQAPSKPIGPALFQPLVNSECQQIVQYCLQGNTWQVL